MTWEFEGVWDMTNYVKYYGKEYSRFIAFLPSLEGGEHNVPVFIHKKDVLEEHEVVDETKPEGTIKVFLPAGALILRQTLSIFKLNEYADESLPPCPYAEHLELNVSLMAIPAS